MYCSDKWHAFRFESLPLLWSTIFRKFYLKCREKSENLVMTGEWPSWVFDQVETEEILANTTAGPRWHCSDTATCSPGLLVSCQSGGTAAAAPPPIRPGNPALCGSHPLVTPYYCRQGDLLCFVFMSAYCMFDFSVYYLFLQYFDTVGWVFWPVKTVSHVTYTVLVGT